MAGREDETTARTQQPEQLLLPGAEIMRLTPRQYRYAILRGAYPEDEEHPDWKLVQQASQDSSGKKPTRRSAGTIACRWNALPLVQKIKGQTRKTALSQVAMDAETVWVEIDRMSMMAFGDLPQVRTVRDEDGALVTEEFYETAMGSLGKALELKGRSVGLFVDRTELTGKDGGPIETMTPEQRAAREAQLRDKLNRGHREDAASEEA